MTLELPIVWNTEQSKALEELGIDTDDYTLRKVTFFNIDAIHPYEEEDHAEHTMIIVGCEEYITPIPYMRLLEMIKEAKVESKMCRIR